MAGYKHLLDLNSLMIIDHHSHYFQIMNFSVKKLSQSIVKPCKPILPPCKTLPFSPLDKFPPNKMLMVDTLLVFSHGKEPTKIIREALSKALVPYFPVAGEFTVSDQGELSVSCTGRGVWFIEASADFAIKDLNMFTNHLEFLPQPPLCVDLTDMFIMIQVTEFKCEGFIVGLRFNHAMFDGVGVGQFMKAIGEIARGHKEPSIQPLWLRDEILINHPNAKPNFPPPSTTLSTSLIETITIHVSSNQIKKLKDKTTSEQRCTTFEVLVAKLWRSRLRAIKTNPDVLVQLGFIVDLRKYFMHGEGYYGNFITMKEVEAPCWKIINGTFSEVVKLIQEAKRNISSELNACLSGECETKDKLLSYEKFIVNDWTKIGLGDVDYGWGEPQSVLSVGEMPIVPSCLFVNSNPMEKEGVSLKAQCVKKEHLKAFIDEIMNFDDDY